MKFIAEEGRMKKEAHKDKDGKTVQQSVRYYRCAKCGKEKSEFVTSLVKSRPTLETIGKNKVRIHRHILALCPACSVSVRREFPNVSEFKEEVENRRKELDLEKKQ